MTDVLDDSPTASSPGSSIPRTTIRSASSATWRRSRRTTAFVAAFANVAAFGTDDGLVLVDTSSSFLAGKVHDALRALERPTGSTPRCSPTATSTTASASSSTRRDAARAGLAAAARRRARGDHRPLRPLPRDRRLQRHHQPAAVPARGAVLADRVPLPRRDVPRPARPRRSAARRFELHHARGETDDHIWVWVPERKVLCTGDLFIWASPNCGNPQKVQRYAIEWARALRDDGRARRRDPAPRPRPADRRRRPRPHRAHRHGRAARAPAHRDDPDDERGRAPRRRSSTPSTRAGRPARPAVPPARSTTSPSSSSATCGACSAAGTTATRPPQARRPTPRSRRRSPTSPVAPTRSRRGPVALADGRRPAARRPPRRARRAGRARRRRSCTASAPTCTSGGSRPRRRPWPRASSAGPRPSRASGPTSRAARSGDRPGEPGDRQ